jgi:hypothetical protein
MRFILPLSLPTFAVSMRFPSLLLTPIAQKAANILSLNIIPSAMDNSKKVKSINKGK